MPSPGAQRFRQLAFTDGWGRHWLDGGRDFRLADVHGEVTTGLLA
jgi:hypothetical protein